MPIIMFIIIIIVVCSIFSKMKNISRMDPDKLNELKQELYKEHPSARANIQSQSVKPQPQSVKPQPQSVKPQPRNVVPQSVKPQPRNVMPQSVKPHPRNVMPQRCNDAERCVSMDKYMSENGKYTHRMYNDDEHPKLPQGMGKIGYRHESWIQVPRGYVIKECEYCGAENRITPGGEYKCYFCWKKL